MNRKVVKKFAWLPVIAVFPRLMDSKGVAWLKYVYRIQNGQEVESIFTHKPTAIQRCGILNNLDMIKSLEDRQQGE